MRVPWLEINGDRAARVGAPRLCARQQTQGRPSPHKSSWVAGHPLLSPKWCVFCPSSPARRLRPVERKCHSRPCCHALPSSPARPAANHDAHSSSAPLSLFLPPLLFFHRFDTSVLLTGHPPRPSTSASHLLSSSTPHACHHVPNLKNVSQTFLCRCVKRSSPPPPPPLLPLPRAPKMPSHPHASRRAIPPPPL